MNEQHKIKKMLKTQENILEYFRKPTGMLSSEVLHLEVERSVYLVRVIERLFPDKTIPILELGSGVGRNLHFLSAAGYSNLSGIEQSQVYLESMNEHYPELIGRVIDGLIEDVLPNISTQFTLIFTMAVLAHIPDDGTVFDEITKRTRFLLTIEDEVCDTWNHFPRDYRTYFRGSMNHIKSWPFPPLGCNFVMRLLKKGTESGSEEP